MYDKKSRFLIVKKVINSARFQIKLVFNKSDRVFLSCQKEKADGRFFIINFSLNNNNDLGLLLIQLY